MQQRPVAVVGAGGHALVAVEVLVSMGVEVAGCWSTDGTGNPNLAALGVRVHPLDELKQALGDADVFAAIGDNRARRRVCCSLPAGAQLARAVSPRAIVSPTAMIGPGALVMPAQSSTPRR